VDFFDSEIFKWVIMPFIIFFARILDVSLGTTRIILVSKGKKYLASLIGFFEVTVWLLVAGRVIQSVDNALYVIAYAGGFAMGNFVGIMLEEKLAIGTISVRLITNKDPEEFINNLRLSGFGVTTVPAYGKTGQAYVIYSIMQRKKYPKYEELAENFDSKAFIAIEDIKNVKEGYFPDIESKFSNMSFPLRKSK